MLLHDLKSWCKTLLQFEKGLLEFFPVIFFAISRTQNNNRQLCNCIPDSSRDLINVLR